MATDMTFNHSVTIDEEIILIPKTCNQVKELAKYAFYLIFSHPKKFDKNQFGVIPDEVYKTLITFHTDAVVCGLSALALKTNAPLVLRDEALQDYRKDDSQPGAFVFGSLQKVSVEKAIVANCSAVREWDSNGTVFGFRANHSDHQAGEFGHNDFYPVVIAAAHFLNGTSREFNGRVALRAMLCLDEIRARLAEVFSLKTYKIDHVLHGSVASAIVYGTLLGATVDQIESAVGMTVSHYCPWRSIRAGHQLSDSKGASAAISTEAAILSVHRALRGFEGPKDIFRNPEAPYRVFVPTQGDSPFNLILNHSGINFAIMEMHLKLGLYEHQSAGAVHGLIKLLTHHPEIYNDIDNIDTVVISSYRTAFEIIGDVHKKDPKTRQSADHSMVYIISHLIQKAKRKASHLNALQKKDKLTIQNIWMELMLLPEDFSQTAITDPSTRKVMNKVFFEYGGPEFDAEYPKGIPTQIKILMMNEVTYDSGLILFPLGHSRGDNCQSLIDTKIQKLAQIGCQHDKSEEKLNQLMEMTSDQLLDIYCFEIADREPIDA